ncbi:MAG: LPXTG cell wall anchor domain-containing protein [Clostridia bacterium]|nr:LPXTG cell wall anchor domain-containing protein [Clostridia bacterium]
MSKKAKIIIVVLLVLTLINIAVLIAFSQNKTEAPDNVAPDNYINKDDSIDLSSLLFVKAEAAEENGVELYRGNAEGNLSFRVMDMLPGDIETKTYNIKVHHHANLKVYFTAVVMDETKNLSDILNIKVTHVENNNVIYDGSFADMTMDGYEEYFYASQGKITVATYKIEVSLPTSAGNEYQSAMLKADFMWFVKDTGTQGGHGGGGIVVRPTVTPTVTPTAVPTHNPSETPSTEPSATPTGGEELSTVSPAVSGSELNTTAPDEFVDAGVSGLDTPKTGDNGNIYFWIILMVLSVSVIIMLFLKKRKEEQNDENKG